MRQGGVLLVTGATGFVGTEVVRRLVAQGREVHALRRGGGGVPGGAAPAGLCWHEATLEDEPALQRAFARAAAAARARNAPLDVLHLAARISYRRSDAPLLWRTNVEGTRAVLGAALGAGARRLCHVSSVVALGPVACADEELDDDAALGGASLDSAYARTKAAAEELALAASSSLEVVVASPAVVFGTSPVGSNSLYFLERLRHGSLGPFAPPGSLSVVGLEDTAEGVVRVLDDGAPGRRYLLSESSWRLVDLLTLASELCGRRPPRACVAPPLWRGLVGAARWIERVRPGERVTAEALALLGMHFRFAARRARLELGWSPRPIADVLRAILSGMASGERA